MLSDAEVYLVKLWAEPRDIPEAAPIWRGSATNVSTGEVTYFQTLEGLTQHLSTNNPAFPSGASLSRR